MPAVAPRKTGEVLCLCLGTESLALSRHVFSSLPAWDGSVTNDDNGRNSETTDYNYAASKKQPRHHAT